MVRAAFELRDIHAIDDVAETFAFNGKTDRITLTIDRPELSPEDIKKLETAMHNNPASE